MMNIKIIDDLRALTAYREKWNFLLSQSLNNHVFLTYEWMSTWWEVFGAEKRLFVLVVEEDGIPVGIIPLYREERRLAGILPLRQYFFLANRFVGSDFLDFIIRQGKEKRVLRCILDYFASSSAWDRIAFEDMDSESPVLGFLLSLLQRSGLSFELRMGSACPYLSLPESLDDLFKVPDVMFKKSVRRYAEKLQAKHRVSFERIDDEIRLPESLETLFALHGERWNLSGQPGVFAEEKMREFYRRISRALIRNGWLHLSALRVDGKIEAMEFGLAYDRKYYALQSGCSRNGRRLKAGNILRYRIIESLLDNMKTYHFLRGAESYKYDWGGRNKQTVNVDVLRGPKGRLNFFAQEVVRNTLSSLRVVVRRRQAVRR